MWHPEKIQFAYIIAIKVRDIDMEELMDRLHVLISAEELEEINTRLAARLDADYAGSENLLLVGVLKGSMLFMADLMKKMKSVFEIDFMKVCSYGAGVRRSSGNVRVLLDLFRDNIADYDILIVEDIVDSGHTLTFLTEYLKKKGARSVRTCTLLDKPVRREVPFTPDYVGREIPDEFVLGYGLDYDEKYRNLPYIAAVRQD